MESKGQPSRGGMPVPAARLPLPPEPPPVPIFSRGQDVAHQTSALLPAETQSFPRGLRPRSDAATAPRNGHPRALLDRLVSGERSCALTFAGQGIPYLEELRALERQTDEGGRLIRDAAALIADTLHLPLFRRSGRYPRGLDLMTWLREPLRSPDAATLSSSVVSQALVFLTQCVRHLSLHEAGLHRAFEAGAVQVLTGHSQGVMPALLVAEGQGCLDRARVLEGIRYYLYQGLLMQDSYDAFPFDPPVAGPAGATAAGSSPTAMAAINRLDHRTLQEAMAGLNRQLPTHLHLHITLHNARTRFVVSAPPSSLERLRTQLEARAEAQKKDKARGRFGGLPQTFDWEYLPVSAAFHSPHMAGGLERMRETARSLGFTLDASRLKLPVLSPSTGRPLNDEPDLTEALLQFQFLQPVRWDLTVNALASRPGLTDVLELGPGDAVARLTAVCLRGSGVRVVPVALPAGQKTLFGADASEPELCYQDFQPRLARLPDGALRVDNRFSRLTGRPPILLPGMTPTTADAPIVAAAANGGFIAELAGGGQVTESILRTRVRELQETLLPGRELVFNALFLDPTLWKLHFGPAGLVPRLTREGAPFCGVTISAGIPDLEEAGTLLDRLTAAGLWLNAFKPGTLAQIDAVLRIAAANPHRTLLIQIEGGKAGGHHSWENLDELLLERYHRIRQQPNLVLCVGGGIGEEARAISLLTGAWSEAYGLRPMPVDAVFVGTLAMACLEAKTSPQVKAALVRAAGTSRWVFAGEGEGEVTSGRSNLNADIHYLDNAAARAGRLLDQVAGDAAAVTTRRSEIIAALNATARPYFGDLERMTYLQVLERLRELMAIGRHSAYEDGIWPDRSYRERFAAFFHRTEARLNLSAGAEVASLLTRLEQLDSSSAIDALLQDLERSTPLVATTRLHPLDVRTFIHEVCRRPGKPVNFVPVIDAQVRAWYKSDSLWAAHDPRYEADQVLVIPGPEAVAGITRADEPVAELLQRFHQAVIGALQARGQQAEPCERLQLPPVAAMLPGGLRLEPVSSEVLMLRLGTHVDPEVLFTLLATSWRGPLARAFLGRDFWQEGRRQPNLLRRLWGCPDRPIPADTQVRLHLGSDGTLQTLSAWSGPSGSLEPPIACEHFQLQLEADPRDPRRARIRVTLHPSTLTSSSPVALCFHLEWRDDDGVDHVRLEAPELAAALAEFYPRALFGRPPAPSAPDPSAPDPSALLAPAIGTARVSAEDARAYAAITGRTTRDATLPTPLAFTLAWEPLFRVLAHPALIGGMLNLVHLSNRIVPLEGWPLRPDLDTLATARLTCLEDGGGGRTLTTDAILDQGGLACARVTSSFFIRGSFAHTPHERLAWDTLDLSLTLSDEASLTYLLEHAGALAPVRLAPGRRLSVGETLEIRGTLGELRPRGGLPRFSADLELVCNGAVVGSIRGDLTRDAARHPVRVLLETLGAVQGGQGARLEALARAGTGVVKPLATEIVPAPLDLRTFAEVGRDGNPLHLSPLVARLAGLSQPIVHGQWTSARAHAFLIERVAGGNSSRVLAYESHFVAPVLPGESLVLRASRTGVQAGRQVLEVTVHALRQPSDEAGVTTEVLVLSGKAVLNPPKTAYIFPGQGIQQANMGMDGYARSPAARRVWDRADTFTRARLGFSLLAVVRENPRALRVKGERYAHEQGVLHLTQFTQVAMAVLAQAQVAELEEADALVSGAITCGHSVGEYNAIGALADVLTLETVVQLVYERGTTMHRLIARDADGESGFRMGVIRPHVARLDEAGAEALVQDVAAETGLPLQIVNYNIRGRQYAVTGRREALERLAQRLAERTPPGEKGAYLEVPGIDTPFHSHLLRAGVAGFREALEARFPARIAVGPLLGHYIPNLVPRPFSLQRDFLQEVAEYTGSPTLCALLPDLEHHQAHPEVLARTVLIELLAYQFASPVRWIETQERLLTPESLGGLGVERVIEIGVGYQPTLSNMARASLQGLARTGLSVPVEILNVEVDRDRVLEVDEGPQTGIPDVASASAPGAGRLPVEQEAPRAPRGGVAEDAVTLGAATLGTKIPAQPDISSAPGCGPARGPAEPVSDRPVSVQASLWTLLALQARVRPEQLRPDETLDQLFEGVSSRRNQVLADLGLEFTLSALDGAHEKPLSALVQDLSARARSWTGPGKYTRAAQDDAITRLLGPAGLRRKEVLSWLERTFGLGAGLSAGVLNTLALETRAGVSTRGGVLGALGATPTSSRAQAEALLEQAVGRFGEASGLSLSRIGASTGSGEVAVDPAAVRALAADVTGPDGVLMRTARRLAQELGHDLRSDARPAADPAVPSDAGRVSADSHETAPHPPHSVGFARWIAPRFEPRKHVAFLSAETWARRDVARTWFEARAGRLAGGALESELRRLAGFADPHCAETARYFAGKARAEGRESLARGLERVAAGAPPAPVRFTPSRPVLSSEPTGYRETAGHQAGERSTGGGETLELADRHPDAMRRFVQALRQTEGCQAGHPGGTGAGGTGAEEKAALARLLEDILLPACETALDFRGTTALVTGAGPGSIARETVTHLLRGGARVIVTTSHASRERLRDFRSLYQRHASPGAELHVVPFNQASFEDVDALLEWIFAPQVEQAGAVAKELKPGWIPDLVLPFAAIGEVGTVDQLGERSEVTLRALLLSLHRLIGGLASRLRREWVQARPCHVVLPLSPNHGSFGGDGVYAESKAALEVLLAKWHSEREAWGELFTLCAARIGWVRSTGLMSGNDLVAAPLEARTGVRTFSSPEMGFLIAGLCSARARTWALERPLEADLTGGFSRIADLKSLVDAIRREQIETARTKRTLEQLQARVADGLGSAPGPRGEEGKTLRTLPWWPGEAPQQRVSSGWTPEQAWEVLQAAELSDLKDVVVIVGAGELGPWGSSRTRFELEADDALSPAGVLELAWLTGLVRFEDDDRGGRWVDDATGEPVAEADLASRYEQAVRERSGIRFVEPAHAGYDPESLTIFAPVYLEEDFTFGVSSEEEARAFLRRDPELTRVEFDERKEVWRVTRRKGSRVQVPRATRLTRGVAGQVPTGFDFARFGIPQDLVDNVDRLTLFNLVATVDAFLSAGFTPELLLSWVHPARVANTQGAGIGGMRSLQRLYTDYLLGRPRQSDILQETLINVIAGYVVQSYVGSYGAMAHPVGACATAAISVEEGFDKIRAGKADFVVAGGFDDVGIEGAIGFQDMAATADTDELKALGWTPGELSRPNDIRRRGFVEGQGGGTLLLARGDIAVRHGLPVLAVVAYAGSFGDGIQRSVPAPGMGILAAALGGPRSPLGEALERFGLEADDIGLVYKHDTSTAANDPNENALHHQIQGVLGRTSGNPLFVVSQKSLTGHAKGGAAAWQLIGLSQAIEQGVIPGNRNLDCLDPLMARYGTMAFTDETLRPGPGTLRAGLATSLGFGHVGALVLLVGRRELERLFPPEVLLAWQDLVARRLEQAARDRVGVWLGERLAYEKRTRRRLVGAEGSEAQARAERELLTDPTIRLSLETGLYTTDPERAEFAQYRNHPTLE